MTLPAAAQALYRPSAWQQRFHDVEADEVLGAGSAGPGKTMALLMDPILSQVLVEHARVNRTKESLALLPERWRSLALEHPLHAGESTGWALHLRRELARLQDTIARSHRIFPQIDAGAHFNAATNTWHFSSGYRFEFGHCQHANDWQRYMGREFSHIGVDELVELEEVQYDQISLRLRSSDPVLGRMLVRKSVSNPVQALDQTHITVSRPMWVRERFVDPHRAGNRLLRVKVTTESGEERYATRIFLPATLYDHPDKEYVRRYEFALLQAKPHIKRALLYGDWYQTVGSYFGEDWNPRLHVSRPFRIPDDWPQFRSMDWGFKSPGCVHWWAMDEDENLWGTRELTFQGRTDEEVADLIRGIEEGMGVWKKRRSTLTGPADTQLWEERGDTGLSKAAAMLRKGVAWRKADKRAGSRVANAERISKRLRDHASGTTTPGLVIFDTCRKLIETLPSIQTDPHDINRPMDGGDDHWFDSLCYAAAYASRGRMGVSMLTNREAPDWDKDDEVKETNRGRDGYGSMY